MKLIHILLFGLAALISSPAFSKEEITIAADEWCPYNCKPDSNELGYVVDIVKEVFAKHNIDVKYQIVNWNRALSETKKGTYNAAIAASYDEGKGLLFPEETIGMASYGFFGKKGVKWKYKNINSLNGKALGASDGYSYYEQLNDYIKKNKADNSKIQLVSGDNALGMNLKKLLAGRIDLFVDQAAVVNYTIRKLDYQDKIALISMAKYPADPAIDNFYLAFSPNNPNSDKYIKIFDSGIKKLRSSGRLNEILKRYNLTDWKI